MLDVLLLPESTTNTSRKMAAGIFRIRQCYLACKNQFRRVHNLNVGGVFPALATPFDNEDKIAWDKLENNMEKCNKISFKGYVALGSTGEVVSLTTDERVQLVKALRSLIPPQSGRLLLAGSGCESTLETIRLTEQLAKVGADAALVVTPSYYKGKMTPSAIENHFQQVADASPLPIILYSVPANTSIDLDPDVVVRLSKHPKIIGMKDSGGDISKLSYMVYKTQETNFQILAGSAGFLMPALMTGCVGGILAAGNVLGYESCQLFDLVNAKQYEEAKRLQHKLIAPNWAVTKQFGIAGVKYAMDLVGLYGGRPRSPLQPLSETEKTTLKRIFHEAGII